MSRYQHILFDLDGTLMDTSKGVILSVERTLELMGKPPLSTETLKRFIGPPIEVSFAGIANTDAEETVKAAAIFRKLYAEEYLMNAEVYEGMEELLDSLAQSGIERDIATYKRNSYTHTLLRGFGLLEKFNTVIGSDDEGKLSKADIINLCIESSAVDKAHTVMIGDTVNDEKAAKAAGIDFIAVTFGFGYKSKTDAETAVFTADSAAELKAFLLGE